MPAAEFAAAQSAATEPAAEPVAAELHRHVLSNGLRVVLAPDRTKPVVGVSVHYDVGYRSEPEGRTGFAHLFEHMMFQGSESLDKLAHFRHVQGSGGTGNASTRQDWTQYHQVLPSAALERALFLEADRMRAPRITEENLRNQIAVVSEEIRLNVLDRPYGGFPWLLLPPVLYRTFANAHNGYGDFTDLEQATVDDCAAFFDAYYPPGNAVLTIAGDIDPGAALDLVVRHFGDVPARHPSPRQSLAEPHPSSSRRVRHPDPHAPLPALAVGYRLPDPVADLDAYLAHVVLAALLADGDASRLRQRLVHRDALAIDVDACCGFFGSFGARDPDTFTFTVIHPAEAAADALLTTLDDELERLGADGPSSGELGGVTARSAARMFRRRDLLTVRTLGYGAMELLYADPGLAVALPRRIQAVTAEQVAAAARSLRPDSRAVVTVEPGGDGPAVFAAPAWRPTAVHQDGIPQPDPQPDPQPGSQPDPRSAGEIGRTPAGPRPLPALGTQETVPPAPLVDTVLDNGLRVIAVYSPSVPMVELRLRVPFGGTEPDHAATAELLATTLLAGTQRRGRAELDAELAAAGGGLEAARDPQWLRVTGRALASRVEVLLDVLADALVCPAYADATVAGDRDRLVEQVTMARADPGVIAREALQRHRYGDHPLTREVPLPGEVSALTPRHLRSLHHQAVQPRGSVLLLVGDLDCERAVRAAAAALGGWRGDDDPVPLPPLPALRGGEVLLVHRPGAVQARIRLCAPALGRAHERFPALQLANLVFGGYFSSRLMANIREDKGYTYSVRSGIEIALDTASLLVQIETSTAVTAPALYQTRRELAGLFLRPPSESEVDAARSYAVGSLLTSTASQTALASRLSALVGEGLDPAWLRLQPERLAAVTVAGVRQAASDFFAPTAFTGVVVGDAEPLAAPLLELGGIRLG